MSSKDVFTGDYQRPFLISCCPKSPVPCKGAKTLRKMVLKPNKIVFLSLRICVKN